MLDVGDTFKRGRACRNAAAFNAMALVLVAAWALGGCGAEVAVGAAAVGGLQAGQAKEAQAQQAQAVEKLKAAEQAAAARTASAADAAGR